VLLKALPTRMFAPSKTVASGSLTDREGAGARSVAGPQLGDGVAEVQL
jgi:hypothetical protein